MNKIDFHKNKLSEMVESGNVPENVEQLNIFLKYVEDNPTVSYYYPERMKEILGTEKEDSLKVLEYFSKGKHEERLASTKFIYHGFAEDDEEDVEVDRDIYYEFVEQGLDPVRADSGQEFVDFDEDRLSFESFVRV